MAPSDLPGILEMVLWGALATAAMTGMMQGALGLGLSRLSIPFMVGAMFSGNRRMATVVGVAHYILGGWAFAFLYFLMLTSLNLLTWWAGGLLGLVHGLVLLVARSEEHTSELQSLMRISYAVFCLKNKKFNLMLAR